MTKRELLEEIVNFIAFSMIMGLLLLGFRYAEALNQLIIYLKH